MSSTSNTPTVGKDVVQPESSSELATEIAISDQKERGFTILEPEERAFAHEFIANGYDHCKAAETIGRSRDYGKVLKRRPFVAAYIQHLQNTHFNSVIVTKDFIDAKLDDLYDMAVGEVKVPLVTGDGAGFEEKKFHGGLALQILQERSKTHKIVEPAGSGPAGGVTINIDLGMALGEKDKDGIPIESVIKVV